MPVIPSTSRILLPTDSSKEFLDALLGQGWANWGSNLGGQSGSELMLQIFGAFNSVALAVVCALFLWVSALATAGTAHEGVAFGKKFSSLWMPVRFVGSIGALAPIFKGLSLFQIALLASIGWSINLGNYVWELGTDFFVENAGQLSVQEPGQHLVDYSGLTNGILKSLTYQYYLKNRAGKDIEPGGSWEWENASYDDASMHLKGSWVYKFNGYMGKIEIPSNIDSNSLNLGKKSAVNPAITNLSKVASQLADPDIPAEEIDSSALAKAARDIHIKVFEGMKEYANSPDSQLHNKLQAFQDMSHKYGWFMAGSSYWAISWINQEVKEALTEGIYYHDPSLTLETVWVPWKTDFDGVKTRLKNYMENAYKGRKGPEHNNVLSATQVADSSDNKIREFINQAMPLNWIAPWMIKKMSKEDPICVLSDVGDTIINAAWFAAGTVAALKIGQDTASTASLGLIKYNLDIFFSFLLYSIFLPLMCYGCLLAYYLPAIPFLRWISALGGWIILIIESLVAAPLWIAAHALPEGEGLAGNHGRRGYMLFLGVLIRPPLMVAGFFCAMLLITVIGQMIGQGFMVFLDGVAQTKIMGLTATLSYLVLLGSLFIMLANKFFNLIHYLPEHVTNWIGQQLQSLGEKEDQTTIKNTITQSASGSGAILKGATVASVYTGAAVGRSLGKAAQRLLKKDKNQSNTISDGTLQLPENQMLALPPAQSDLQ